MRYGHEKKQNDHLFVYIALGAVAIFSGLLLLEMYGIFTPDFMTNLDIEQKLTYSALLGLIESIAVFMYLFREAGDHSHRY